MEYVTLISYFTKNINEPSVCLFISLFVYEYIILIAILTTLTYQLAAL